MHIIKGHYRNDSGALEVGTLMVDRVGKSYIDAQGGFRLFAENYAVTSDTQGVQVTSPDAAFEFLPDAGELDRIGMPVKS